MAKFSDFADAYQSAWVKSHSKGIHDLTCFHEEVSRLKVASLYPDGETFRAGLDYWGGPWSEGVEPKSLGRRLSQDAFKATSRTVRDLFSIFRIGRHARIPKWLRIPKHISPVRDSPVDSKSVFLDLDVDVQEVSFLNSLVAALEIVDEHIDDDGDLVSTRLVDAWMRPSGRGHCVEVVIGNERLTSVELPEKDASIVDTLAARGLSIIGYISLQTVDSETYVNACFYFPQSDE